MDINSSCPFGGDGQRPERLSRRYIVYSGRIAVEAYTGFASVYDIFMDNINAAKERLEKLKFLQEKPINFVIDTMGGVL